MPPTPNKVESTWGNAIRDRVINVFANTTARDAAITSPVLGMHCYVTSVGLMQYSSATLGWTKPWYSPWGEVNYAEVTANQTGISTVADLTGLTIATPVIKDRIYRVSLYLPKFAVSISSGSGLITAHITDSVGGDQATITLPTSNGAFLARRFVAASTTTLTRKGRLQIATVATVDLDASATSPAYIQLEDLGANADPS